MYLSWALAAPLLCSCVQPLLRDTGYRVVDDAPIPLRGIRNAIVVENDRGGDSTVGVGRGPVAVGARLAVWERALCQALVAIMGHRRVLESLRHHGARGSAQTRTRI